MNADLAALGLKLETKDLEKGIQVLDKAGVSAEKAADKFDRASKETSESNKRAGGSFEKLSGVVQGSAAAYLSLATATAAAISIGKQAIANAEEAIQVQKRLEAVYRATGGTVGFTTQELNKMADAMAASSSFDDESIRNGMAELIKFGNIHGKVFTDALKVTADYAAFSGTAFPAAAAEMGRALADVDSASRLLRSMGVAPLTEAQKDLISQLQAIGREAEAQQIILDKLKGSFGGTDAALNSGLTGAVKELSKAWNEMLEAMGKPAASGFVIEGIFGAIKNQLVGIKAIIEEGSWADKFLMMIPGGSIVLPAIKGAMAKPQTATTESADPAAKLREQIAAKIREIDALNAVKAEKDKKDAEAAKKLADQRKKADADYWKDFDRQNKENLLSELGGNVKLREKYQAEELERQQKLAKERYGLLIKEAEFDRENQIKAYEQEKDLNAKLMKQAEDDADAKLKLIEKEANERQKMIDGINQSLTDALMRGFESGKGFGKNFIETIQNMFNTLVLRPIISAVVSPIGASISAGVAGLFGSATASADGGSGGSIGGGIGSILKSGFDMLSGTFTAGVNSLASTLGSNFLLANASTIGTMLGVGSLALGALGLFGGGLFGGGHIMRPKGYANTRISSSGVSNIGSWTNGEGNVSQQAIDAGLQLGRFVDDMAKKLGGTIEKSFIVGTKYMQKYGSISVKVGAGITKTNADFTFLASDKNAVSNAFARTFLDSVIKGLVTDLPEYLAKFIGAQKDGSVGNSGKQAKFLQNAIDLKGLYDSLDLLPDIFGRIKLAIDNVTSKDMLEKMQALTSATQNFYNLFTPESQKIADNSAYLHKQLSALNVAFPDSRDGFMNLVKGIDTSTQSGLDLYTTLVNLATPMDSYYKALESQADAASRAAEAIALSTNNYTTLTDFMRAKAYIKNGNPLSMLPANMPSYDVGTDYVPVTGPALIHQGEAIIPAGQNANLASSLSAAVTELRAVKSELSTMKKTLSDISRDSRKTSDTLVRVTLDGASMQTRAVA